VERRATEKLQQMRTTMSANSLPYFPEDASVADDSPSRVSALSAAVPLDSSRSSQPDGTPAGELSGELRPSLSLPSDDALLPSPLAAALAALPADTMARCGVVVLGLYASARGLVTRHVADVRAVAEPSADAAALLAAMAAAAGGEPSSSLEALLDAQRVVVAGDGSGRLWHAPVCSSMCLLALGRLDGTPAQATVCSMLVYAYQPEAWADSADVKALAGLCTRRLAVSACELPADVVQQLLEGGAVAVVCVARAAWAQGTGAVAGLVVRFVQKLQAGSLLCDALSAVPAGTFVVEGLGLEGSRAGACV